MVSVGEIVQLIEPEIATERLLAAPFGQLLSDSMRNAFYAHAPHLTRCCFLDARHLLRRLVVIVKNSKPL
jgi:hypothetical protein